MFETRLLQERLKFRFKPKSCYNECVKCEGFEHIQQKSSTYCE